MTFLLGYGTILLNMTLAPTASFNSAAVVLQSLFSFSSSDAALMVHFAVSAVSSNSSCTAVEKFQELLGQGLSSVCLFVTRKACDQINIDMLSKVGSEAVKIPSIAQFRFYTFWLPWNILCINLRGNSIKCAAHLTCVDEAVSYDHC